MDKVVFFCPSKTWGGVEKNVLLRAKFLADKGYKVHIVLLKNHFTTKFESLKNVEIIQINSRGNDLNIFTLFNYIKLLKTIKPKAVFVALKKDWWLVSLAAHFSKVSNTILYLGIKRKIKTSIKYKLVFNTLKAKVLVNSDSLKKHLLETTSYFNNSNLFRIYNGFQIPENTIEKLNLVENKSENIFFVGCAGRFSYQKGFDLLPEIIKNVPKNIHFIHIGQGPLEEEIKTKIKDAGLSHRIHFLGYLADSSIFFNSIDLFLLPSRFEGMANVLNEALSHGKPVISTKVDGSCELLDYGKYGILTDIEDTYTMADAITKIQSGEIKFDSKKQKERISSTFSMEKMISETEKLLFATI
ncbi:glycosyltransferase [Cellulophaga baltica]|uniref:glycosyltransferase n=1 Tax=Cellulophaga TaxID=104264 RepID=UPI001C07B068|nr:MULTISPECIES: glycosyltransferase [Cellulophaga]MBU2997863.1 glycosyltransferase [Cellulophaga baltica]MDO6769264.1 glycosyltransferase [Cellulophaga sp. 1_MG-2023]